jgi:hypothetical protein
MDISNAGLLLMFALAVATLWLASNRFSLKLDNNWPLVYYALLVLFSNLYPRTLNAQVLYAAVICGLMLRFEFLNERIVYFFRILEMACFGVIGWRLFELLYNQF